MEPNMFILSTKVSIPTGQIEWPLSLASFTANMVEGLVKLLCRMTSGGRTSGGMALPVNCSVNACTVR